MKRIYLDYASGAPLLPDVREAMAPFLDGEYGNPSALHQGGRRASRAMEEAREKSAALIGARAEEILFTSCGTEANNLALKGLAFAHEKKGQHLIVSKIEHQSVLYAARRLERQGFRVTHVGVDKTGRVDPEEVRRAIEPDTVLISIALASGELGTLEPIREIVSIAKERGILVHTDAVSACGAFPVDVEKLGVDGLSLAANPFYGPVGAAALYLRRSVRITPLLDGGGQEDGRRSGTETVASIVGMGKAAELARLELDRRRNQLQVLRDELEKGLLVCEGVVRNGHPTERLAGYLSVSAAGIEGESLLLALDAQGISVSNGSACNTKAMKPSHVLQAIGLDPHWAQGTILFTVGLFTQQEEIATVREVFPKVLRALRRVSSGQEAGLPGILSRGR